MCAKQVDKMGECRGDGEKRSESWFGLGLLISSILLFFIYLWCSFLPDANLFNYLGKNQLPRTVFLELICSLSLSNRPLHT